MWTFQYKHGDRPLEGFTIQRAAGRGGFGEVYYAISDSGREVALKAVQGYEQIELRGISQCMNLKSPHLVTIFDVKYNAEGRPFVIMEFVAGPSLRQLLDESPAGLGTQKAAFFLREIGKGLTFLHECGIVHRDLKPGNVFFENGYVKIGDYGLSKAISPTQHSGQTVTVGTVHYMAPEIGAGKYDRSIDIYAMGAMLYELLTGTVPFIGASPSEILIKHLQNEPDLAGIPEPFAGVIKKAMAKDPADRYASIQEMVEAVFGADHVRMSVSHFSPDELSVVAARVAQKVAVGAGVGGGGGSSSVIGTPGRPGAGAFAGINIPPNGNRLFGTRIRQLGADVFSDHAISENAPEGPSNHNDPLPQSSRLMLALLTAVLIAVAGALLCPPPGEGRMDNYFSAIFAFVAICGGSLGLMFAWRRVLPKLKAETVTLRRLAMAGTLCAFTFVPSIILRFQMRGFHDQSWIAILLPLALIQTARWVRADRAERVSLRPPLCAGFFAFVAAQIFGGDSFAMVVPVGVALAVQVLAPWDPRAAASTKRRTPDSPAKPMTIFGNVSVDSQQAAAMQAAGTKVYGNLNVRNPANGTPSDLQPLAGAYSDSLTGYRLVPRFAPFLWLATFIVTLTLGVMCLIAVGSGTMRQREEPIFIAFGVAGCLSALVCLWRVFARRFFGWWSYLVRPVMMLICANTALTSAIIIGNSDYLRPDAVMVGAFFIVFPGILFFVLPFMPRTFSPPSLPRRRIMAPGSSPHRRGVALIFALLWFVGAGGIHRIYVGKIGTGILWLLTGGLLGIGQLIDVILIISGQFKDAQGRVLTSWDGEDSVQPPPLPVAQSPIPPDGVPPDAPPIPMTNPQSFSSVPGPAAFDNNVSSWRQAQQMVTGGLFSVAATLLLLASLIVGLAIGLDLPGAVGAGLPDAQSAAEIRRSFFGDVADWPLLMGQILWATGATLSVLSLIAVIIARRQTTLLHIVRGILGAGGLFGAIAILTNRFEGPLIWQDVQYQVQSQQAGHAVQAFFNGFHHGAAPLSAVVFVVSFLMLAIPARRRWSGAKGAA